MANKCNSCGGIYNTTQPDGSRYFHACAPIPNPTYQPDPTKGTVVLQQTVERPNKRDENIAGIDPVTKQPIIISAGTGIIVV
jgi:ssDNA-binding Zn-finger/Zn-ribbon topoisomerase 1